MNNLEISKKDLLELSGSEVSDSEFNIIEKVAGFYPNIKDKINVSQLYKDFGITIFTDMHPRAVQIEKAESKMLKMKQELEKLQEKQKQLLNNE